MHRLVAWWLGTSALLAYVPAHAITPAPAHPEEAAPSAGISQVREGAKAACHHLVSALSGSVHELRGTVERSLRRSEANPYATVDGEVPTLEQLAFRLTQHGPYDTLIAAQSEKWGLDPFLLKGLLLNESGLQPTIRGKKEYRVVRGKRRVVSGGAVGIAQFSASGIKGVTEIRRMRARWGEEVEVFTAEKALDPEKAIPAAAEVLSYYISLYGRDGGITAYNTGMAGGQMVKRYGFYKARAMGKLRRAGHVKLQGDRFLLNVLRRTNRLRIEAGLSPLPGPDRGRKEWQGPREKLPVS